MSRKALPPCCPKNWEASSMTMLLTSLRTSPLVKPTPTRGCLGCLGPGLAASPTRVPSQASCRRPAKREETKANFARPRHRRSLGPAGPGLAASPTRTASHASCRSVSPIFVKSAVVLLVMRPSRASVAALPAPCTFAPRHSQWPLASGHTPHGL